MKTLTLTSPTPKNDTVQLDIRSNRICNFCGEGSEICGKTVEGSYKQTSTTQKIERRLGYLVMPHKDTTYQYVPTETEEVFPFFGEPYTKVVKTRGAHVLKDDLPFEHVSVLTGEYETREYPADICLSCIRQLAKLTKDMKVE